MTENLPVRQGKSHLMYVKKQESEAGYGNKETG